MLIVAVAGGCTLENVPKGVVQVDRATFSGSPPAPASGPVGLPHEWPEARRLDYTPGTYRLTFDALQQAGGTRAFVTLTSVHFVALVNGQEVHESGARGSPPPRSWRMSQSFPLPEGLLRPRGNELELRVAAPPGLFVILGPVWIGDSRTIERLEFGDVLRNTVGPLLVGMVIATVGVFALAMWWQRRDGPLLPLFGTGALLWGAHTMASLLPERPLPPPHWNVWWTTVYCWVAMTLACFSVRFAGARWPWFDRAAIAFAVFCAPVLYAAGSLGVLGTASAAVRAAMIAFVLAALAAVVRRAARDRDVDAMLLLAAGMFTAAFGIHDWIAAEFGQAVKPVALTPYGGLFFLALAGWMLIDRYNQSREAFETLNRDLERRVHNANAALERQLADVVAARDEAERASTAKSRFFAAASHDLRQPIHSLGLFASALERHVADVEGRTIVRRIGDSIVALELLFDELLDLSKIDSGAVSVQPRDFALQPLFDRLSAEFHAEANARELRMRFVPTALGVRSDPVLLERILTNLVSNALRYTRSGGVVVGARRRGAAVRLEVWDSGIGIAPGDRERVFEEFYQAGNPQRDRSKGLGLGLAIVRRLAGLLGHAVDFDSVPGKGTRFRLELPRALDLPAEEPAPLLPSPLAGSRVLVVDDEAAVREGTEALLAQWGCVVASAASADDALALVADGTFVPDVALVDLRLPGKTNGAELVGRLHDALGVALPALLITGDTATEDALRAKANGIPMLTKPVAPARLRAALFAALTRPAP
jgi:signal transduction histidine kinase